RLQRPYFSPKSGSYEIDLAFSYDTIKHREQIYLFAININTKSDGEKGLTGNVIKKF
ncbi:MAG: hypothetical protein EZS28_043998, partial [Streblomastix strix]